MAAETDRVQTEDNERAVYCAFCGRKFPAEACPGELMTEHTRWAGSQKIRCWGTGKPVAYYPPTLEPAPGLNPDLDLLTRLRQPFRPEDVLWRPVVVRGNRALVAPYVKVHTVEDRLDEVFDIAGWADEYEVLPGGAVLCRLWVKLGEHWTIRCDVGAAPGEGDERGRTEPGLLRRWLGRGRRRKQAPGPSPSRVKAATTDALKRAAAKLGIGRYLAQALKVWVDWDPVTREPRQLPQLVVRGTATTPATPAPPESPS